MKIIDRKFLNVTTPTCHASTIAFYKDKPIYAWFGGTREGLPDSAIYIQCGDKIATIGSEDVTPRWNPILFPYKNDLFLFVKMGKFCDCWATVIYNISNIFNEGCNISSLKPQILPAGLNGPTKTKPIVFNGFVYCGSSVETCVDWSGCIEVYEVVKGLFELVHRTHPIVIDKIAYKDFYGAQKLSQGIIQPAIWFEKKSKTNSTFHAFFRSSRGLGKIYHSYYEYYKDPDDLKLDRVRRLYMTKPEPTKFDNPNSGIDTVYFDKRLFLVYNPSVDTRIPLVIHELDNDFDIKNEIVVKQAMDDDKTYSVELSYPYMIEHDGRLHLTYTYGRSKIENVTIEV